MRRVLKLAEPWLPDKEVECKTRVVQPTGCFKLCSTRMKL